MGKPDIELTRRDVLKLIGLSTATVILAGCAPGQLLGPTITPTNTVTPTLTHTPTRTATATASPSPTPTPDRRFTVEAMTRIPKSEAEIASCVEIASPIDNPDQYSKDMDGYLKTLHEQIFPGYTGAVIGGDFQIAGNSEKMSFIIQNGGVDISPVTCARFKYNNQGNMIDVVLLTLVGQDKTGMFAINLILNPLTIPLKSLGVGHYGTQEEILPVLPATRDGGFQTLVAATNISTTNSDLNNQLLVDYFSKPGNGNYFDLFWNWGRGETHIFDRGVGGANEKRAAVVYLLQHK
jgi:hypothetical protein